MSATPPLTSATSGPTPGAQQETGEGPEVAAVAEAVVYFPAFPDPRWPALGAHASNAVRAVGERSVLEQLGHQLHDALASRDVIGQAKGSLMERLRITPEDAFDTLRRSSQRLNVKLREIAQKLAETGELDDAG
jgi:hypothetical protein